MTLFMDQIPDGAEWDDYPPDTKFILDDSYPKRDEKTLELIFPNRPKITPEEAWESYRNNAQKPEVYAKRQEAKDE